jgi:hypothetical protein
MAIGGRPLGLRRRVIAGAAALVATGALAQAAPVAHGGIYSCVDDKGRRITSDRPITDCNAKEQRILNKDGSVRSVRPPSYTADERAEMEARDRQIAEARVAQADAVRRDRNLLQRYKTEVEHNKAREAALDSVRAAMRVTQARLADLERERKPLVDEAEFYPGRQLPPKLKSQFDANDAALAAQRAAQLQQEDELVRINRFYDAELERLKRLWNGAQPGALGAIVLAPQAASAARP